MNAELKKILEELKIEYELYEHPPVFTVPEAEQYWGTIEAIHCKNLFVRNEKGNKHYLIVVESSKTVDLKSLRHILNEKNLSKASTERLTKYLGVEEGSVSPLGLINDTTKHVKLILDNDLKHSEKIGVHPNINTETIVIARDDLFRFIKWCGNEYIFFDNPNAI
jgi:Ala-tRNA(Pro) deacylase